MEIESRNKNKQGQPHIFFKKYPFNFGKQKNLSTSFYIPPSIPVDVWVIYTTWKVDGTPQCIMAPY